MILEVRIHLQSKSIYSNLNKFTFQTSVGHKKDTDKLTQLGMKGGTCSSFTKSGLLANKKLNLVFLNNTQVHGILRRA